jgi:lycopene beta-cyclase
MPAFFISKPIKTMNIKPTHAADYLFIGLGAANCLLILKLYEYGLLSEKSIAIIEPNGKNLHDRNFCFWSSEEELLRLQLNGLVSSKWEQIKVAGRESQSISPLRYHHVRGIDLKEKAKKILIEQEAKFYEEAWQGEPLIESESFVVGLSDAVVIAEKVFDSRPPQYELTEKNQSHLLQSFYGWTLETGEHTFDQSTMVMMDFNVPQSEYCQFMYVLPFAENTALFEVTRFGKEKITKEEAEHILNEYVTRFGFSYKIIEEEKGVIPMSSGKIITLNHGENWINTGAGASMIKPTSGYAFYNMAVDAGRIAEAIGHQQPFRRRQQYSRFNFYDRLLLKILEEKSHWGKPIFVNLFRGTSINKILRFLSEKSSLSQEISIFSKLPLPVFLSAAANDCAHRLSKISPTIFAFVATTVMVALSSLHLEKILYVFLGLGFFSVGLSHGAVDHLIDQKNGGPKQLVRFVLKYTAKGALFGLLWILEPDLALAVFLLFSAWHFGQADFREWNIKSRIGSFAWGASVLAIILFFHLKETIVVLKTIDGLRIQQFLRGWTESELFIGQITIVFSSFLMTIAFRSKQMLLTMGYLLLAALLPLLVAFGTYFVMQHSMHGWKHLKTAFNMSSYNLWLKSLPFSIGGALILLLFLLNNTSEYVGLFFILLSCLSVPHILMMNQFYVRRKKV